MIGLFKNVGLSAKYTWTHIITKPLRLLGMMVLGMIPILRWFVYGVWLKPFRNEEPSFTGEVFWPGLVAWFISLLYSLPILLIVFLPFLIGIVAVVLFALYGIFLLIFFPPAIASYGNTGKFRNAFDFKVLTWAITQNAGGFGRYIGALFIYIGILGILILISLLFIGIPLLLFFICWIFFPILSVFSVKYWANLLIPNAATNGIHVMNEEEAHDAIRETIKYLPTFREEALIHKEQGHTQWITAFLSFPQNIATFRSKINEYTNADYTDEEVVRYLRWWYFEDTER